MSFASLPDELVNHICNFIGNANETAALAFTATRYYKLWLSNLAPDALVRIPIAPNKFSIGDFLNVKKLGVSHLEIIHDDVDLFNGAGGICASKFETNKLLSYRAVTVNDTQSIDAVLKACPTIQKLSVISNTITNGCLPDSLTNSRITSLTLNKIQISMVPLQITFLDISNSRIAELPALPCLHTLIALNLAGMTHIANLPQCELIMAQGSSITRLSYLPRLRAITANNYLNIRQCPNLTTINIGSVVHKLDTNWLNEKIRDLPTLMVFNAIGLKEIKLNLPADVAINELYNIYNRWPQVRRITVATPTPIGNDDFILLSSNEPIEF